MPYIYYVIFDIILLKRKRRFNMNVIVCLDDKNGMLFNKRRQSQDKILRLNIKEFIHNKNLFMNNYSYKLFKDIDTGNIKVSEDFLNLSHDGCFLVEDK